MYASYTEFNDCYTKWKLFDRGVLDFWCCYSSREKKVKSRELVFFFYLHFLHLIICSILCLIKWQAINITHGRCKAIFIKLPGSHRGLFVFHPGPASALSDCKCALRAIGRAICLLCIRSFVCLVSCRVLLYFHSFSGMDISVGMFYNYFNIVDLFKIWNSSVFFSRPIPFFHKRTTMLRRI